MSAKPFLFASAMRQGTFGGGSVWKSWWEGVWRLHNPNGVVRWHCPHHHRTERTALACSEREVTRRFGNWYTVRGVFK